MNLQEEPVLLLFKKLADFLYNDISNHIDQDAIDDNLDFSVTIPINDFCCAEYKYEKVKTDSFIML